ncbi:MAG: hypothetical protein K6C36_06735 [Clostridia bacterium]|nr:hypothetical protein [Clostridia bacterium]
MQGFQTGPVEPYPPDCRPVDVNEAAAEGSDDSVVYRDERYTLCFLDGAPCLVAGNERFILSCHPYEPCLYINDENGRLTAVRNAFDPQAVLEYFRAGKNVVSITGFVYTARDFCLMVEFAAKTGAVGIDDAEKVFAGRKKENRANKRPLNKQTLKDEQIPPAPAAGFMIEDAAFSARLAGYPYCVVDFRIVKNDRSAEGTEAHRLALARACADLLADDEDDDAFTYDCAAAQAKHIDTCELFAPWDRCEKLNYCRAFLCPPTSRMHAQEDFELLNAALFPNGISRLEVMEWTTDWSDYFDDGHEWWGALCLTVYDGSLDRFVVIMASATD